MSSTVSFWLDNETNLDDLYLDGLPGLHLQNASRLQFLSVVETSRIPLHLMVGSPFLVNASKSETSSWFSNILLRSTALSDGGHGPTWWELARSNSPLGILVAVKYAGHTPSPHMTELLLYASREDSSATSLANPPTLKVKAIALSSDLLHPPPAEPTPPSSPVIDDEKEIDAVFLPPLALPEVINEPPVRKRKSATEAFDEANERRKKARRKGGEGVAAAAAPRADSQMPSLKHQRNASASQPAPPQTRPLSRSPSVSSTQHATATEGAPKRSNLSRVQSATDNQDGPTVEDKNKMMISRVVMAGMRLYNLSQSKSRKSRAGSSAASPAIDATFDDLEAERKRDEEYKLVYHQVYRGTCFAFRSTIELENLQSFSEAVRDVVDRLLAIFCHDPLSDGLASLPEQFFTPGGRQAFGTGGDSDERSPFDTKRRSEIK